MDEDLDGKLLQANKLWSSVPTLDELEKAIVDADIYEISSSIQDMAEMKESCAQKGPYLEKVVNMVNKHI